MEYKIIDILFPILLHFLALQLMTLTGIADAALRTMLAAVITMPLFLTIYRRDEAMWPAEKKKITWYAAIGTSVAAAALNLLLSALLIWITADHGSPAASQEALLSSRLIFQILGMGAAVPITEELVFRGLVYRKLERYLSERQAVLLGAALFAIYHGNVTQALFAFPMGVILNLLYRKYRDLRMPILFHAASNLTAVLLTALQF